MKKNITGFGKCVCTGERGEIPTQNTNTEIELSKNPVFIYHYDHEEILLREMVYNSLIVIIYSDEFVPYELSTIRKANVRPFCITLSISL